MRLLIAAQTGHVFVFDTVGVSAETGNAGLSCQRLHPTAAAGNEPPSMPVSINKTCPCHSLKTALKEDDVMHNLLMHREGIQPSLPSVSTY